MIAHTGMEHHAPIYAFPGQFPPPNGNMHTFYQENSPSDSSQTPPPFMAPPQEQNEQDLRNSYLAGRYFSLSNKKMIFYREIDNYADEVILP